jgi:hypothetical protein
VKMGGSIRYPLSALDSFIESSTVVPGA